MKMHLKAQVDKVRENMATLMLTALTAAFRAAAGVRSTCEASKVNEGDSATITCHFDNDIGKEELDVHVNRYNPDKENIFRGAWFSGEFHYHSDSGVSLDGIISNNLTLKIMQATKEKHAGTYMCQAALSGDSDTIPCTLIVSDIVNEPNTSVMNSLETTLVPNAENEMHQDVILGLTISLAMIAVVLLLLGILLIVLKKRNVSRRKPCPSYMRFCNCSSAVCINCTVCKTAKEESNVTKRRKTSEHNVEGNAIDLQVHFLSTE